MVLSVSLQEQVRARRILCGWIAAVAMARQNNTFSDSIACVRVKIYSNLDLVEFAGTAPSDGGDTVKVQDGVVSCRVPDVV